MSIVKDSTVKSGALRGRTGPLVRYPLDYVAFKASNANLNKGSGLANADGSGNQVSISQTAFAGSTAVAFWKQRVQGATVGLRWRSEDGTTTQVTDCDVIIDGVCYPVEDMVIRYDNDYGTSGLTYQDEQRVIAENLSDDDHTVSVVVVGNPDGATTRTLTLYGFLADSTRGHPSPAPAARIVSIGLAPTTLPTTAGAVPFSTNACSGFTFYNGDTGSHTVTVYGPDGASPYLTVTLTAGQTYSYAFPGGPRTMSGWKWKVDTGTLTIGWIENAS